MSLYKEVKPRKDERPVVDARPPAAKKESLKNQEPKIVVDEAESSPMAAKQLSMIPEQMS